MPFSLNQRDEEVLAEVIASYFTPEELAQARQLESYEEAIAYLTRLGAKSLRDSGEERPPRVYMTIPGGRVLVHHPARLFPEPTLYAFSVHHLALQAFPPPHSPEVGEVPTQHTFWCDDREGAVSLSLVEKKAARKKSVLPSRVFVEQSIRLGTKDLFWTRQGWAVKKGFLGYVLSRMPSGSYRVELVHLVSNWVLACVSIESQDETTHGRLQAWVCDAHALTDWSRGISAILAEQPGKQKKWAWTQQLEVLWHKRRQELRQVSFF